MTEMLSFEKKSTLPTVVVSFNLLIDKIEEMEHDLDIRYPRTPADVVLLLAIQAGKDKTLKHYKKSNWMYYVSLILDPRHKLETIDYSDWGKNLKDITYSKFNEILKEDYCDF